MNTYAQIYAQSIANGCTPVLADMLASRQAPGTKNTERAFFEGEATTDPTEGFGPQAQAIMRKRAKAAGVSLAGKRYMPSLADSIGDPRAWVSDISDVRRLCIEKGAECPALGVYAPPSDQPTHRDRPYCVSPKLVEEQLRSEMAENPDLRASKKRQAARRAELKEKLSGRPGRK